jgi:hypothetical protein
MSAIQKLMEMAHWRHRHRSVEALRSAENLVVGPAWGTPDVGWHFRICKRRE